MALVLGQKSKVRGRLQSAGIKLENDCTEIKGLLAEQSREKVGEQTVFVTSVN